MLMFTKLWIIPKERIFPNKFLTCVFLVFSLMICLVTFPTRFFMPLLLATWLLARFRKTMFFSPAEASFIGLQEHTWKLATSAGAQAIYWSGTCWSCCLSGSWCRWNYFEDMRLDMLLFFNCLFDVVADDSRVSDYDAVYAADIMSVVLMMVMASWTE